MKRESTAPPTTMPASPTPVVNERAAYVKPRLQRRNVYAQATLFSGNSSSITGGG